MANYCRVIPYLIIFFLSFFTFGLFRWFVSYHRPYAISSIFSKIINVFPLTGDAKHFPLVDKLNACILKRLEVYTGAHGPPAANGNHWRIPGSEKSRSTPQNTRFTRVLAQHVTMSGPSGNIKIKGLAEKVPGTGKKKSNSVRIFLKWH